LTGLAKRPYLPGFQGSVPHLPPLQQVHAPTHLSCVSSAGLIIPHPRRVCQGHSPLRTQVLGSQGIASAPKSLALRRAIYYHARDGFVKGLSPQFGAISPNSGEIGGRHWKCLAKSQATIWRAAAPNSSLHSGQSNHACAPTNGETCAAAHRTVLPAVRNPL